MKKDREKDEQLPVKPKGTIVMDRLIAMFIAFLVMVGLPTATNFAIEEIKELQKQFRTVEDVVGKQEFSVESLGEGLDELYVTWNRCVEEYLLVDKNYELYQLLQNGTSRLIAKSPVESIDFNEGCREFVFRLETENWKQRSEVREGKHELIMQLVVTYTDGEVDSAALPSDIFLIDSP